MQIKTTGGATDFAAVYAEHYASVARTAFLLLGESGEAEEITQEAFATLFQRWDTVLNPAGFVRTAMLNRFRDTGRRRTIRLKLIRRIGNQQHDPAEPEFVLDMLKRLDHQLREVVVLRYYVDLTVAQIAAELGVAEGTVKSRLHRAIILLRHGHARHPER